MKVNGMKYRKVIISLDLGKNGGHTTGGFSGRLIVAIRQSDNIPAVYKILKLINFQV